MILLGGSARNRNTIRTGVESSRGTKAMMLVCECKSLFLLWEVLVQIATNGRKLSLDLYLATRHGETNGHIW